MLSKSIFKQVATQSRVLLTSQKAMMSTSNAGSLNQFYIPNKPEPVKFTPKDNKAKGMQSNHRSTAWKLDEIQKSTEEHVVFTWGATDPARKSAIAIERGEGVYLFDYNGKRYTDMTSQAINNNLGYGIPEPIHDAISK